MKRYLVTNRVTNIHHGLFDTVAEALADAIKLQDQGKKVAVLDTQGTGEITVNHFDVLEAEGYVGHGLGSDAIQHPTPIEHVLESARHHKPEHHVYFWDTH